MSGDASAGVSTFTAKDNKLTTNKGDSFYVTNTTSVINLTESSSLEGTINGDNSAKSIILKLDSSSTLKLTGDTYVTSLEDSNSTYSNIDFNGYKLYVNGTAIN